MNAINVQLTQRSPDQILTPTVLSWIRKLLCENFANILLACELWYGAKHEGDSGQDHDGDGGERADLPQPQQQEEIQYISWSTTTATGNIEVYLQKPQQTI